MTEEAGLLSLREAELMISLHRFDRAEILLRELLSQSPADGTLHFRMAAVHFGRLRHEEAVQSLRTAMECGFQTEECRFLLARATGECGLRKEAEEHWLSLLRENPLHAGALARYGMLMLETGHLAKGRELVREALRVDPENADALQAQFLISTGESRQSVQHVHLQRLFERLDGDVGRNVYIGVFHLVKRRYRQAHESFRQAFLLDPQSPSLLELLEQLDQPCHWSHWPRRIVDRCGGPAVLWLVSVGLALLFRWLGWDAALGIWLCLVVLLLVWSWSAPVIYRLDKGGNPWIDRLDK